VREDGGALAVEERVFGKGRELVGIGVRTGGLASSQLRAQRVGRNLLHGADPSLL
jgi:hypothetical protein